MTSRVYRDRDYAFGGTILALRVKIGLTQAGLADILGVSRRTVVGWEAGNSYPKTEHLKQFIALAIDHHAFPAGCEELEIHSFWQTAHQKILLDEDWLASLLTSRKHAEHTTKLPEHDTRAPVDLPFQSTSFVGRIDELAEIDSLLGNPACRLLTLLGPGGIGKTRLALEMARRQTDAYQDGVTCVDLAPVGTSNQLVSAIGRSLSLSFSGRSHSREQLLAYLQERQTLLLLDNFEHLLEGTDLVSEILTYAPQVRILLTSRERLSLRAEWLFEVSGLSCPPSTSRDFTGRRNLKQMNIAEYSAVQLFIQRTAQVQPGYTLLEADIAIIASICQHVMGMPLAIELAAANTRVLSLTEIDQQIRSNLDVLTTTLRDVPARHRSLRAVFDHSWELLSEREQILLSRLAVFRGGFTAAAAMQVAGATLTDLIRLVDKSLVHQTSAHPRSLDVSSELNTTPIGAPEVKLRFDLLEPIREYALEKLAEYRERDALQLAHAEFYLALAEAASTQWDTTMINAAIAQQRREHDNTQAALKWACENGRDGIGLQLALALWEFWRNYGYGIEGRSWLEKLLSFDEHPTNPTAMGLRQRGLRAAARLASEQHDFVTATRFFAESMALRRDLGQFDDETDMLINAAHQARAAGKYQRATTLLEDALARQRLMNNSPAVGKDRLEHYSPELGLVEQKLALVLRERGEFARATELLEVDLDLYQRLDDRVYEALSLLGLADIARDQGNADKIRRYGEPSLMIFRQSGIQWAIGFALNTLAMGAYYDKDLTRALSLIEECVALFRDLQSDGSLAEVLITYGSILHARGEVMAAQETLTDALQLALRVGPLLIVAAALEALSRVIIAQNDADLTIRLLSAASHLRSQMGTPTRPADQPGVEQALVDARSSMTSEAFATVWLEGQSLPLTQIVSKLNLHAE